MPHMSSMGATYYAAQDLIYALQDTALVILLVKLMNGHKEALKTLAKIFRKANRPPVPLRVPVREVGQNKFQEVNQEVTQMKWAPQSNPITNAEPLRVPIVKAYSDELQPVNQSKKLFFQTIRGQDLIVTPKIERLPKIIFE